MLFAAAHRPLALGLKLFVQHIVAYAYSSMWLGAMVKEVAVSRNLDNGSLKAKRKGLTRISASVLGR